MHAAATRTSSNQTRFLGLGFATPFCRAAFSVT